MTANDIAKDLPKVYFQVRISKVIAVHQCNLDTPTHRIAIQNSGTHVIDPEKFQTVIEALREEIHLDPVLPDHGQTTDDHTHHTSTWHLATWSTWQQTTYYMVSLPSSSY